MNGTGMSLRIHEIPGGREEYENITARIRQEEGDRGVDWRREGMLFHVAGPGEDGWRVIELWASGAEYVGSGSRFAKIAAELALPGEVLWYFPEVVHLAPKR